MRDAATQRNWTRRNVSCLEKADQPARSKRFVLPVSLKPGFDFDPEHAASQTHSGELGAMY